MFSHSQKHLWACLLVLLCCTSVVCAEDPLFSPEQLEFFEKQVRPLLVEQCYECHSGTSKSLKGNYRLDSRQGLLKGGDSGASIEPGHAEQSLLIEAVKYESYEMPPNKKLSAQQIQILEQWVNMGAPWPLEEAPENAIEQDGFNIAERKAEHWVWKSIQDMPAPQVKHRSWPKSEVDHFILAKLEQNGLTPAKDVDKTGLIRRLYFDLIGLPPTPEEIAQYLEDSSEGATERLVDRLLASPHFGERWGRHWLDLVRYAESRGHEFDNDTPNAFQYRDYVIRALNADVPYDQFVREHIAGDLIKQPRLNPEQGFNESILGTGFWFMGEWVHSPVDTRKDESDRFDNMIDVMSKTFQGMTVSCARCHDHKFDAISTADYYSLSGFLQSSDFRQVRFESIEHNKNIARQLAELDQSYQTRLKQLLNDNDINCPESKPLEFGDQAINEAIVVDYNNIPSHEYRQDGYIFGQHPQRSGELKFSEENSPRVEAIISTHAGSDHFWNGLVSINENVRQSRSALTNIPRSGRTLRTPTFKLKEGNIACLVEGVGHVVAVVDSHRLVFGPLHGQTIKPIAENERWAKLNLSRYVGHNIHLEFTPAHNKQLAVRLVMQGLDDQQLKQLDDELVQLDRAFIIYAAQVDHFLNGEIKQESNIFEDFESGTYDGWTVTGDAFGTEPQTLQTIASYQGKVNALGKFFVNSHNKRIKDRPESGDIPTGRMTSPKFKIDFHKIEFLVGGGAYPEETCVNLLVDGKAALTATGKNNNQMSKVVWDVRHLVGKEASIELVDERKMGWGNIGLDHIVFIRELEAIPATPTAQELVQAWKRQRDELKSKVMRNSRLAMAMMDGTGEDDHILIRGNSSKPGPITPRRFLTALRGLEPMQIPAGSGRLVLAECINDPENPLTSRVIVNRIWHHLLGRGIVPTTDDFGVLGQRPSQADLLDHLAMRFLQDGQSIKQMIKYIVHSRVYQLSSHSAPQAMEVDPENLLWHHRPPRRLEGEVIRDSLLAISGRLDRTQFGEPVPIHLTPFMDGRGRPGVNGPLDGAGRRTIYVAVRRNFLSPFMQAFDAPVPFSSMGRRNVSNVPAQALILMNDPFVIEQSQKWVDQVCHAADSTEERIEQFYLTAFARYPTQSELNAAKSFVQSGLKTDEAPAIDRWYSLGHALINTKEFIFLR